MYAAEVIVLSKDSALLCKQVVDDTSRCGLYRILRWRVFVRFVSVTIRIQKSK